MSDIAISVENLGKKYTIGANQARYQTVRESLTNAFQQSFQTLKGQKSDEENTIWALKDVNFEVKHGEVLGIIGRNGAGKSTLLKILARITKPTTGRIELNGRVGSLLEVGTGFHPELTGRENIYLSGAILGMKRLEIIRKFDEIVDFAEIEKFLDTPSKHYSSGMYMRLAFAVAAHLEPEILLVDEVLAVGDAEFQKKCLGKMGEVASEGRTVLFVSHQIGVLNSICTKGALLSSGNLLFFGLIQNAIAYYSSSINFTTSLEKIINSTQISKIAQFLFVSITHKDNKKKSEFDVFDNLKLTLKYKFNEKIIGAAVIFYLKRNNEIIFVSFDTDRQSDLLENRKIGLYSAEIDLPCPLKAGLYTLSISIGILNGEGIDTHENILSFKVSEIKINSAFENPTQALVLEL